MEMNQFMDARPSVPSESCGYWLDFHRLGNFTFQLSIILSLFPALNWYPAIAWEISVLAHFGEMHLFIFAGYAGKEKAP